MKQLTDNQYLVTRDGGRWYTLPYTVTRRVPVGGRLSHVGVAMTRWGVRVLKHMDRRSIRYNNVV